MPEPEPVTLADAPLSRIEQGVIGGLLILLLFLRVIFGWKVRFSSDESQHLHVVWAWANGLLPYRDVFDNHTPLFHMLSAPVFRLFPECAEIMIYMRWAMIPLFATSLWCIVKIGTALFSRRTGWWAAILSGYFPLFLLKTVEFRTDILWTTTWLAAVAIAVGGPFTWRRMFCVGLVIGAAFCVSMKTVILLAALLLAAAVMFFFYRRKCRAPGWSEVITALGAAVVGMLIVPGCIIGFFAVHHAVDALYYGVIAHNLLPDSVQSGRVASRTPWLAVSFPFFVLAAYLYFLRIANSARAARRTVVLLAAGFFVALLHGYWPLITDQDYLPVLPALVLMATPLILYVAGIMTAHLAWLPAVAVLVGFAGVELQIALKSVRLSKPFGNGILVLGETLRLTNRDDYVMDPKAGAIYRRRPFYYALEDITMTRMKMGLIKDDIIERLIATHTCVASANRLTGKTRAFVMENYVHNRDNCRVAGQTLHPDDQGRAAFEIKIVTTYVIVAPDGKVSGKLDGKPYAGKIMLESGHHEFVSDFPSKPLLLVWAQAIERGMKPDFKADTASPETGADL